MKKLLILAALTMSLALTLAACGGKKESKAGEGAQGPVAQETTVEETNPENGLPLSKQPDPNAPKLTTIIVYAPGEDGKMAALMDAAAELNGESVVNLLIAHGTLAEGVKFVSLEEHENGEAKVAGPGGQESEKVGKLTLSSFAPASGVNEEAAKQAVMDTFCDNFELNQVELVLN